MTATFDIDAPRWDQGTFAGRLRHFLAVTDPRLALAPAAELERAKALVEACRAGLAPAGSSREQLRYAKTLYDSAFHPDSGERMNLLGRMSFQVPAGMALTGCMLQFYRTVPAVVFWQWVNQSFNAVVNYTNRNAASAISPRQIAVAYVTATGTALATAVGLNLYTKRAPPLVARWVPFAAVAAANCVNIPMMRQQEIINGITVTDEDNNELGRSRRAAAKGIAQVVVSRITMAAPGMIILPIIMERLEKFPFMKRIRLLHGPLQVLLCGGFLLFMVPAACALFPQRCSLALADLEPELRASIVAKHGDQVQYVYFNKGLETLPAFRALCLADPLTLRGLSILRVHPGGCTVLPPKAGIPPSPASSTGNQTTTLPQITSVAFRQKLPPSLAGGKGPVPAAEGACRCPGTSAWTVSPMLSRSDFIHFAIATIKERNT